MSVVPKHSRIWRSAKAVAAKQKYIQFGKWLPKRQRPGVHFDPPTRRIFSQTGAVNHGN